MEAQHEPKDDSEGPMASLDDDLDELALERLELLDDLLKNKQMLAEYMKTGFFNLGKARYSLGGHAVSALRIPETSIIASTKTRSTKEKATLDVTYTTRAIMKNNDESEVRSDETNPAQRKQVEEITEIDSDGLDERANKKPINWFSALPPACLRQAQSQFESALQLAAQCASLQDKLTALDKKYCHLVAH